jgi:excisionase family DNA binding protein
MHGYVTPGNMAKRLGVTRRTVTNWVMHNKIKNIQIGTKYLIDERYVDIFGKVKNIALKEKKIPMIISEPDTKIREDYVRLFQNDFAVMPLIINEYYINQLKKVMPLFIIMDIDWVNFQAKEIIKQIKSDPDLDYVSIFITTKLYDENNIVDYLDLGVEQFLPKKIGGQELLTRVKSWLLFKYGFNSI